MPLLLLLDGVAASRFERGRGSDREEFACAHDERARGVRASGPLACKVHDAPRDRPGRLAAALAQARQNAADFFLRSHPLELPVGQFARHRFA